MRWTCQILAKHSIETRAQTRNSHSRRPPQKVSRRTHGVDPRVSTPWQPEGRRGYSPSLRLWWRSLYLIEVPIFKFFTTQAGSIGLV